MAGLYDEALSQPSGPLHEHLAGLVNAALNAAGTVPDTASRKALMSAAAEAAIQAAVYNRRRAEGDFSPDDEASRFPPKEVLGKPVKGPEGPSLIALYVSYGSGSTRRLAGRRRRRETGAGWSKCSPCSSGSAGCQIVRC